MTRIGPGLGYENNIYTGIPCRRELTPIIPVRFSLTKQAIENTVTGAVPDFPQTIHDTNYQLRRLRQGYLYIYADLGLITTTSDGTEEREGKWLVFEYHVSSESDTGVNEAQLLGERYHFRKYTWENGLARNKWILDTITYPYAFVSRHVTMIEYAYSEQRWPAEMFELLESNGDMRASVMQYVSLSKKESDYSFDFKDITSKVADFNPDTHMQKQDIADSHTRSTALGYNPKHNIDIRVEEEYERAKVIAVHDPAGNIADVSCFHQYMWTNLTQEKEKYKYAVVTAKAVTSVKSHFEAKPPKKKPWMSFARPTGNNSDDGKLKSYPIDYENLATLKEYASDSFYTDKFKSVIEKMSNIVDAHIALIHQEGNYTLIHQLKLVTEQAINFAHNDPVRENAVNEYAAHLHVSSVKGMDTSTQGMHKQAEILASNKPYGKYLGNILKIAQMVVAGYTKASNLKGLKRIKLEMLLESVKAAQIYQWTRLDAFPFSITQEKFLSSFGLQQIKVKATGKIDTYSLHLEEQTRALVQGRANIARTPAFNSVVEVNSGNIQSVGDAANISLIVPENQYEVEALQHKLHITHKVGVFFASMSLMDSFKSLEQEPDNLLLNPILQTCTNLMSYVAVLGFDNNGIKNKAIEQFVERIGGTLSSTFKNNKLLGQQFEPIAQGSSSSSHNAFANIGRAANILAIGVAIGKGIKAHKRGDNAAQASAGLAALSELAFLLSELSFVGIYASPLFVAGIIMVLMDIFVEQFVDNEFEAWTRNGFWGNSPEYWDQAARPSLYKRLQQAEILSSKHDSDNYEQISNLFTDEMNEFYNLIWKLTIQNKVHGDNQVRIYCKAFKDEKSVNQLDVQLQRKISWVTRGAGGENISTVDTYTINKQWLYNGCIQLSIEPNSNRQQVVRSELSNYVQTSVNYILSAKYPQLSTMLTDNGNKYFENTFTFKRLDEI